MDEKEGRILLRIDGLVRDGTIEQSVGKRAKQLCKRLAKSGLARGRTDLLVAAACAGVSARAMGLPPLEKTLVDASRTSKVSFRRFQRGIIDELGIIMPSGKRRVELLIPAMAGTLGLDKDITRRALDLFEKIKKCDPSVVENPVATAAMLVYLCDGNSRMGRYVEAGWAGEMTLRRKRDRMEEIMRNNGIVAGDPAGGGTPASPATAGRRADERLIRKLASGLNIGPAARADAINLYTTVAGGPLVEGADERTVAAASMSLACDMHGINHDSEINTRMSVDGDDVGALKKKMAGMEIGTDVSVPGRTAMIITTQVETMGLPRYVREGALDILDRIIEKDPGFITNPRLAALTLLLLCDPIAPPERYARHDAPVTDIRRNAGRFRNFLRPGAGLPADTNGQRAKHVKVKKLITRMSEAAGAGPEIRRAALDAYGEAVKSGAANNRKNHITAAVCVSIAGRAYGMNPDRVLMDGWSISPAHFGRYLREGSRDIPTARVGDADAVRVHVRTMARRLGIVGGGLRAAALLDEFESRSPKSLHEPLTCAMAMLLVCRPDSAPWELGEYCRREETVRDAAGRLQRIMKKLGITADGIQGGDGPRG